ncbi:hypothetical protein GCM10027615_70850 [Plantactinospora veratri]
MGPLGCDGDRVDLWALDLTAGADDVWRLTALLDAVERDRAARLAGPLRRRFVVAHGLTRTVLGGYLGRAPHLVVLRRGRHGKPGLDGLEHNVSHHGDVALLAVTAYRPVGVDVADGPAPGRRRRSRGGSSPPTRSTPCGCRTRPTGDGDSCGCGPARKPVSRRTARGCGTGSGCGSTAPGRRHRPAAPS